ncbi:MAG: C40 family peptidase [Gemmatimonadota bacterium]
MPGGAVSSVGSSLPAGSGEGPAALVQAGWVPSRSGPSHRAELVTQWLSGETLDVLEESEGDWLRCRGPDGYVGWSSAGGLRRVHRWEADEWNERACVRSLGARLRISGQVRGIRSTRPVEGDEGPGRGGPDLSVRLPWGARLQPEGVGFRLADGSHALPDAPGRLVGPGERARLFPASGPSVVSTAARWLNVPYVWGGRTEWGVDCSGFVQAVFSVHGVELPRDSCMQRECGEDLPLRPEADEGFGPGELLFFAPEGRGITHVAISAGAGRILHAAASNGVVLVEAPWETGARAKHLRDSLVARTRLV